MSEQGFDDIFVNQFSDFTSKDKIIYISFETYHELKRYISIKENRDNRCKSFDNRILELLMNELDRDIFNEYKKEYIGELKPHDHLIPLNLRPQTYLGLKAYGIINKALDLDKALYNLIEKAIRRMQIKDSNQDSTNRRDEHE